LADEKLWSIIQEPIYNNKKVLDFLKRLKTNVEEEVWAKLHMSWA